MVKKISGTITHITDLSNTAKELTFTLSEPLDFIAGSFINVFVTVDGAIVRRAFSISSSDSVRDTFSISIRHTLNGVVTPLFWKKDMTGETVEIMGPLGPNTADKMHSTKAYLFGYGVGVGVIKSVLDHIVQNSSITKIVVMTGSRSEDEILHRDYFDTMEAHDTRIEVRHIVSQPNEGSILRKGYIQDHIDGIDFNDSDVYMCGQEVACNALTEKIRAQNPQNCHFFTEAFH